MSAVAHRLALAWHIAVYLAFFSAGFALTLGIVGLTLYRMHAWWLWPVAVAIAWGMWR